MQRYGRYMRARRQHGAERVAHRRQQHAGLGPLCVRVVARVGDNRVLVLVVERAVIGAARKERRHTGHESLAGALRRVRLVQRGPLRGVERRLARIEREILWQYIALASLHQSANSAGLLLLLLLQQLWLLLLLLLLWRHKPVHWHDLRRAVCALRAEHILRSEWRGQNCARRRRVGKGQRICCVRCLRRSAACGQVGERLPSCPNRSLPLRNIGGAVSWWLDSSCCAREIVARKYHTHRCAAARHCARCEQHEQRRYAYVAQQSACCA